MVSGEDGGDEDELQRRTSSKDEKSAGIVTMLRNRAPPFIWRPGHTLTRDLVKLASRLNNPEEVAEVFKI